MECTSSTCATLLTAFITTLEALQEEMFLKETENGPPILKVTHHIERNIAICKGRKYVAATVDRVKACLHAGDRYKLPSAQAGKMWSSFHKLRVDPDLRSLWTNFLSCIELPASLCAYSAMALQVVLDRLLKKLISLKKEEQSHIMSTKSLSTLTIREQNVIHYTSGYNDKQNSKSHHQIMPLIKSTRCLCMFLEE